MVIARASAWTKHAHPPHHGPGGAPCRCRGRAAALGRHATGSRSAFCACRAFMRPVACPWNGWKKHIPALRARRRRLHQPYPRRRSGAYRCRSLDPWSSRQGLQCRDDTPMKMADYFDLVADHYRLGAAAAHFMAGGAKGDFPRHAVLYERNRAASRMTASSRNWACSLRYPGVGEGLKGMRMQD